jgi:SAM-dependent methyltransferase
MAIHGYAVVRMHLALEWLLPVARAGGRFLDIGCASGYYSVAFAKAGGRATGIDISDASIRLARRRAEDEGVAERCEFLRGDMRSLEIEEGAYDVVSMIEVLEHVREQREAVGEAVRVLRPRGLLVITTPHAFDAIPRWQRLLHRNAPTAESAGVVVKRLDTNPFVTEAGIEHEPYFHDAFTFAQIRNLLPPDVEVVRLHSLWMPVPGLRMMTHLPSGLRRRIKRRVGGKSPSTGPPEARDGETVAGPVPIPALDAEGTLMVRLSKLMWNVPVLRMTYKHHLLVARRA